MLKHYEHYVYRVHFQIWMSAASGTFASMGCASMKMAVLNAFVNQASS